MTKPSLHAENQQSKSQDLSKTITQHIHDLAQATDQARMSEEMLRYLDVVSRFHTYSPTNIWLILMSNPNATHVAGYNKWQDMKRQVRRGEKGIPILAPMIFKEDPDDPDSKKVLGGFRVVYVFDISQTDGEPLPEPPNWKSPEKNELLASKLILFADARGISVSVKDLRGGTQGVSKGGCIEIDPHAGTKTLIHEIAHELMHRGIDRPVSSVLRELEAESVAYVVGKHFGLDHLTSPNYISLHGANSEMILRHIDRIRKVSEEIILAIDGEGDL
jgi:hypothetical protein